MNSLALTALALQHSLTSKHDSPKGKTQTEGERETRKKQHKKKKKNQRQKRRNKRQRTRIRHQKRVCVAVKCDLRHSLYLGSCFPSHTFTQSWTQSAGHPSMPERSCGSKPGFTQKQHGGPVSPTPQTQHWKECVSYSLWAWIKNIRASICVCVCVCT